MLDACREISGSDASFTWASEDFLLQNEVVAWSEMPVWLPDEAAPHLKGFMFINCDKAIDAGLRLRSVTDTIGATLSWYQTDGRALKAGLDSEKEKALLQKLRETSANDSEN
jgi:2'-hydroxyisoflavone reductase